MASGAFLGQYPSLEARPKPSRAPHPTKAPRDLQPYSGLRRQSQRPQRRSGRGCREPRRRSQLGQSQD